VSYISRTEPYWFVVRGLGEGSYEVVCCIFGRLDVNIYNDRSVGEQPRLTAGRVGHNDNVRRTYFSPSLSLSLSLTHSLYLYQLKNTSYSYVYTRVLHADVFCFHLTDNSLYFPHRVLVFILTNYLYVKCTHMHVCNNIIYNVIGTILFARP